MPTELLPGTAETFRRLWRGFGSAVALIATEHQGARQAMLATAVTSVSMEPPSLLICVNRSASAYGTLGARRAFSLGVLPSTAHGIGAAIGHAPTSAERFAHGTWHSLDASDHAGHGLPWLAEAQATLFCVTDTAFDYGTHTIFIARIAGAIGERGDDPLLYCDGRYGRFGAVSA